jgi:tetratricopeptide (TPR) repeat protein
MIRTFRAAAAASILGAAGMALCGAAWSADAPVGAQAAAAAHGPISTAASGDVILNSNPQALACQDASKFGDFNSLGIDQCTLAIAHGAMMSTHDMAATYTDRGAIYMQHHQYAQAMSDFDTAIKLDPNLGNAYVNRGGSLVAMKRYAEGIADIDHGLTLNPDSPEKAYFNRAIADENLDDMKQAFADYSKAAQIAPNWAAAKTELARFSTHTRVSEP